MRNLAPIALFVYNRTDLTEKTLNALILNDLAPHSSLFVYSDGPKNDFDISSVFSVRELIKRYDCYFSSVSLIEREKNLGLADNIADGVTSLVNQFGKIIVLEDDILTSKFFLTYMNNSLNYYENNNIVMHISGYMYPIEYENLENSFFLKPTTCWGWGTWKRAWTSFNNDADRYLQSFDKGNISDFNINNSFNYFNQIKLNKLKKIKTWAVFWYASVYSVGGLSLHPKYSYTQNIGFDGSGTNCQDTNIFNVDLNNNDFELVFPTLVSENYAAKKKLELYFNSIKVPLITRVKKKFFKLLGLKDD